MRLFRPRVATLLIKADEGSAGRIGFEGLIVYGGRRMRTDRIAGETPYRHLLPNRPVTIIVAPTDPEGRVSVAYELTRGGRTVLWARARWPISVIQRQRNSVVAAGFDGPFASDDGGAGRPATLSRA